jgi:hypothetical protein
LPHRFGSPVLEPKAAQQREKLVQRRRERNKGVEDTGEETEGKRQRRRDRGEETEEKRQRGRDRGKRLRVKTYDETRWERDRGEQTDGQGQEHKLAGKETQKDTDRDTDTDMDNFNGNSETVKALKKLVLKHSTKLNLS